MNIDARDECVCDWD